MTTRSPAWTGTWTWPSTTRIGRHPLGQGDQLVDLVVAVDQRALGQGVGAERGDDEAVGVGRQDRPAGREAVRRRADRRGDDQAVAPVGHHVLAVDRQADLEQVERRRGPEDHVVEPPERPARPARGDQGARQRHQVVDGVVPTGQVVEPVEEAVGGQLGDEAEPAQVDPQDRRGGVAHPSGGVQDRAVAAEDQGHVGVRGSTGRSRRPGRPRRGPPPRWSSSASPRRTASRTTSGLVPLPRITTFRGLSTRRLSDSRERSSGRSALGGQRSSEQSSAGRPGGRPDRTREGVTPPGARRGVVTEPDARPTRRATAARRRGFAHKPVLLRRLMVICAVRAIWERTI